MRLFSADDHVQEPPMLWTERLSRSAWGDRVPHVARLADGREGWVVDGKSLEAPFLLPSEGVPTPPPLSWKQAPAAGHDPGARLKAMDRDGIEVSVLYPWVCGVSGQALGAIGDGSLERACVQAYNDWLLDTWAAASPRFVPQCIVPLGSIEAATKEMERAVARGHRGVVMPPLAWHVNRKLPHLYDRQWDPFWAKAIELDVPICWHSGGYDIGVLDIHQGLGAGVVRALDDVRQPVSISYILSNFLFSGIPERFPQLKLIFASSGIDWLAFLLEVSDFEWDRVCHSGEKPYPVEEAPSRIFHRQCYVTLSYERAGVGLRSYVGVDNMLWESEFPLGNSTWPRSRELVERTFHGVAEEERDRILWRNLAGLYKLRV